MNIFTPGLLSGQTAIVTGGSRGIGRAVAFALAKSGANVAIISRSNNESTEAIAEQLSSFGVRAISYGCDVSNFDESAVIVKQIINNHSGRITVKSVPGKGSSFIVSIPLKQKDSQEAKHE